MKYLVILGVGAVIIASALLFVLFGGNEQSSTVVVSESADTVRVDEAAEAISVEPFVGSGSLSALLERGQSLECAISYQAANSPVVEGTYFVHDGRVRGDFITTVPEMGGDVLSSMIVADGEMYSWSDIGGQQYGMKMPVAAPAGSNGTQTEARTPIPDDAVVDYDCRPWTLIDNSIFEPPSTVLFQDMSSVMDAGMEYGTIYSEGEVAP